MAFFKKQTAPKLVTKELAKDAADDEKKTADKFDDPDLEKQAKEYILSNFTPQTFNRFFLSREKARINTPESDYRTANVKEIQNKRFKWYEDNIKLFSLVLRTAGFKDEDIKCSIDGTKPLGMTKPLYDDFNKELAIYVNKANQRITKELGKDLKLRIILQGSYVRGYSANPFKGDRFIPSWLFMPSKKSDYDFRCYADGLDDYVEKLRKDGVKIEDRSKYQKDKYYMILPSSVGKVFPEFSDFEKKFEELSVKHLGKNVRFQISVVTKNIDFEPQQWDMEVKY